jgi:hypothetical protein
MRRNASRERRHRVSLRYSRTAAASRGPRGITAHLKRVAGMLAFTRFADIVKHETSDPGLVILEFSGLGRGVESGEPCE